MQRLAIGDVAAVLIFFLDLAADVHVRRILGELENVRTEKTNPAFNGGLQRPDGGHYRDYRENADRNADHRQRSAQLIRAQRRQRHLNYFTKEHLINTGLQTGGIASTSVAAVLTAYLQARL